MQGPIRPITTPQLALTPTSRAAADKRPGFAEHLKATFEKTNNMQFQAKTAMEELATGRNGNIHETLLSMSKAETSFKMLMQVRNKVLNAYQEVQRMQF
ncbi:MAG: flagellar hook-basal body complex protein FliE [Deltaproteobacteria bacterium]|jgi:flagellar hook-basal body complex protein FliE|nr:flagellar hook-basal body complex protein FliE [Deltaproteobacteria bacterium]